MRKKTLYMIGNSHIDPVWFWDWDEGMQEVKATFASALDRLREYPDVKFTSTSSAFFEWIEQVAPEMFEEIRQRVEEGRWELTGGWFIEPDCILPCGEAFVRQGLYAQRYFQEKFGTFCRTGSNVDSFGHTPMLPQILKKSGMQEYVFMRPRLQTPVFVWESPDGSRVNAISLPSEYTTWFYESTKDGVQMSQTAAQKQELSAMACCYGVGNHGGGPTRANIETVHRLQREMTDTELKFSTYREFFDSLTQEEMKRLPVIRSFFDKINTGCYSMDGRLKRSNRMAQQRLLCADAVLGMDTLFTGQAIAPKKREEMKGLWKTLLFNQFHDTLGGTSIKPARDEAVMQLSKVCADTKILWTLSLQHIMQELDTTGEGFPFLLFNPSGRDFDGNVAAEINWFCKDGLILKDPDGIEIPYQRVHTAAKARNYNLGGRRGIVFHAHVPALGFAVYHTLVGESALCDDSRESGGSWLIRAGQLDDTKGYRLENDFLRLAFDRDGHVCSLLDKQNHYEALSGKITFPVWKDERDTWGYDKGDAYLPTGKELAFESLQLVENGRLRKIVRATYRLEGSILKQDYILYHDAKQVQVVNRLYWDREWQMLRICCPLAVTDNLVYRESAYYMAHQNIFDDREYSMHRFVDVTQQKEAGLLVANDSKYAFVLDGNKLQFPVARSAIYAQGNGKNWYNPVEGYEYADIGKQEFTLVFRPHGTALLAKNRYEMAEVAAGVLLITTDNCHAGKHKMSRWRGISVPQDNVEVGCIKVCEDGNGMIIRLFETEGRATGGSFELAGKNYPYRIGAYEILSLRVDQNGGSSVVNMLEEAKEPFG